MMYQLHKLHSQEDKCSGFACMYVNPHENIREYSVTPSYQTSLNRTQERHGHSMTRDAEPDPDEAPTFTDITHGTE